MRMLRLVLHTRRDFEEVIRQNDPAQMIARWMLWDREDPGVQASGEAIIGAVITGPRRMERGGQRGLGEQSA